MNKFFQTLILISFFGLNSQAEDVSEVSAKMSELGPVKVIGSSEEELTQPSSAHFISKEKLELQQQSDVNRVLKQVPGVYVREEDGFGLRPNIGLRGTHPDRSKKIVILEDGILIGPAPYSAPAAYYTPFMSKIESLEVFKGVASVPYGPNSIGGAINYITRSIPKNDANEVELAAGTFNTQKYRGNIARVFDRGGVMLEGTHMQTDGFKKLDSGDKTGFSKNDFLLKGEYHLDGDKRHSLQMKVGYANELSDETYLGLSLDDFDASPFRRYNASEKDLMDWQHEQYQLTYKAQVQENWGVWATVYHNKFHRDWRRFDGFRDGNIKINSVLLNPSGAQDQLYHDILTGNADSASSGSNATDIAVLNNNRYFYSQGIQFGSFSAHTAGTWTHQVSLGLRLHDDQIRRDHIKRYYSMTNSHLVSTGEAAVQKDLNRDTTQSVAVTASDEMLVEAVPGLKITTTGRFETVNYSAQNDLTNTTTNGSENFFVPGVGVLQQFTDRWSAFAGINRGYSIVGPGQTQSSKAEESINYEAGVRYSNADQEFFVEGIGFWNDYQNIKDTCSFSSGCTTGDLDQTFDGGKALITGLEARVQKGFQYKTVYIPVGVNATFTKAEFKNDFSSNNEVWGNGTIHSGDPLPYVPETQYSLSVGAQYKKFTQEVVLSWTGKMYNESVSTNRQEVAAYGIVDWSLKYQYDKAGSVYARLDNILDREYLVSMKPYGARPGKARSVLVGLKHYF
ncbi:TonB-dependent receptor family protein [Bdellovibrio sp. BCCA]|uniref:TonB-dependent receptor family protein n=1 Tax=Bdellovibrio sp. BCCA TaxID=3136281 RepID=UPI0030F043F8